MSWGRRTSACLLLAAVPWLAGCGDQPGVAAPTPVLIPGATSAVPVEGQDPVPSDPTSAATSDPTSAATSDPGAVDSASALFDRVGGAMVTYTSVHLSVGTDDPPPVVEADHQYIDGTDYTAEITVVPDSPLTAIRVDGVTYVQLSPDQPFAEIDPDDVASDDSSVVGALPDWDVLKDLTDVLDNADSFEPAPDGPTDVEGTAVETYRMTVDASFLVDGAQVPDDLTGPVEVLFSIDGDGLPVRVDERFVDSDQLLRTDYSDWGVTVDAEVPSLG